jgi:histidyl-tRNA synthetase
MQFDADTVGSASPAADAEMCMMAADTMEKLGFERGQYVVKVNNRKVLDGVLESIGLGGDENAGRRLTVLRAIDKLDRLGVEGLRQLLGEGRKDESGDFTKGAGLSAGAIERIVSFADFDIPTWEHDPHGITPERGDTIIGSEVVESDIALFGAEPTKIHVEYARNNFHTLEALQDKFADSPLALSGIQELLLIAELAASGGYHADRIRIDPSVVRGLEYYTGPVYEAELLAEIPNEDGVVVRFGSVGGGGRYDGLVSRFRGEPVPATGFSIGVSRLMTALKNLGKLSSANDTGPVVVLAMDRDTDSLGRYQKMVAELRAAGIRAEMYLGGSGMKAQMKYADRRGAPCVVIQGGDERAKGEVQIKDLVEGARQAAAIAGHAEYKEARPGQVSVPEADLVATVRGIIEAQKAERKG